jgi:rhodanese-related sulfurtransferase
MNDITAKELKERISNNENLNIVDVRENWEYEEKNIGAKLIPLGTLPDRFNELEPYKNEELIVHCRSGKRSAQAKKFLESKGFTKVRNLETGIEGYLQEK